MNIQIEPAMIILQVLLSLVGFLSVFILTAIWSSQKELNKSIAKVMTQVACHDQLIIIHSKEIEDKCSKGDCLLKQDNVHIIVKRSN